MTMTIERMRAGFLARDTACDGRFVAGVTSTGVYCRPSCPAKKPREENLRFFPTPAAAEAAGFRPCLRCRPDDFRQGRSPERESLVRLAQEIRKAPERFRSLEEASDAAGLSPAQLSEAFHRYYHRSAGRFLAEARVDKARSLLALTRDKVVEIGEAVGYESPSSFNANFRRINGLSPREYRALPETRRFILVLPGGRADWILRYQGRDPESACERTTGSALVKALQVAGEPALLEMAADGNTIRCTVSGAHPARIEMFAVHAAAIRLLGFAPDPVPFERFACSHPLLRTLVAQRPGLRIPQTADFFEGLAWAIIGQQINLYFAYRLREDLVRLAGRPAGRGLYAHPAAEAVAALDYADLQRLRFSRRKAEYLIDAARLLAGGGLALEEGMLPVDELLERLLGIRGIGVWSANYLALRAMARQDCVPLGDTGLAAGLQEFLHLPARPANSEVERLMEDFKPYRGFVTFHLWQGGGGGA